MQFDSTDSMLKVFHGDGLNTINVPYVTDRWVKIQAVIDLDNDWTQVYYDDNLVTEYTWTGGVLGGGGGALEIAAVDLYANGSTSVYYDDLKFEQIAPVPSCVQPGTRKIDADLNHDMYLNFKDLRILASDWLSDNSVADIFPSCGDGIVNLKDFAIYSPIGTTFD
ncbi:MAG: hypothetical protein ACYTEO_10325, partial [Planctomycetota bacterium]